MRKLKTVLVITSCLAIAFACNNPKKQSGQGFAFEGDVKQTDIEITKSFIYLFPAPGEILNRFYEADLTFNTDLLHDANKVDTYLTSKDKGLNLGIYLTDMAYAAIFSRSSDAVNYLDVVRKLSSELNVSTSTFEALIDRAKKNVGVNDSLVDISNEVFFNMVEFLESSGMESTIAVISSGAYVESMYLALNSVDNYDKNNPIIQQIAELKYPMENLLGHIETVSDDPNVQSILKFINELNDIFKELESKSGTAVKSEPGVISFSGGSSPDLNEENFQEMKATVIEIRNNIVGTIK